MKTLIETKTNKLTKFKFVFDDSTQSILDSNDFREAAILAMAARIRSKKTKKIVGMWSKNEAGQWEHVVQQSVNISLTN